ncbi:MAG: hypothetical protein V2B18_12480 [Pseudomonadota bacterium]
MNDKRAVSANKNNPMEKAASRTSPTGKRSLWSLLRSIHTDGFVSKWVTLETVPLMPLVELYDEGLRSERGRAAIHVILTSEMSTGLGTLVVKPPWGYLCWEWPSRRLLAMVALRGFHDLPRVDLNRGHFAVRYAVDALEEALESGGDLPGPDPTLCALYEAILKRFDFAHKDPQTLYEPAKPRNAAAGPLPPRTARAGLPRKRIKGVVPEKSPTGPTGEDNGVACHVPPPAPERKASVPPPLPREGRPPVENQWCIVEPGDRPRAAS